MYEFFISRGVGRRHEGLPGRRRQPTHSGRPNHNGIRENAPTRRRCKKDWDKANKDIKLGGIGILTWNAEKGKIKTRKVGKRATGSGAAWGVALGAITGILSGGVTLIGGALAGAAGGAVLGALFHKNIGLSDEDKARLEQHLQNGGAAIVVMADEEENAILHFSRPHTLLTPTAKPSTIR